MTDAKNKSGRGGKRTGSGRKIEYIDPIRITVTIEKSEADEIEKRGHKIPVFLREAGIKRLKEGW